MNAAGRARRAPEALTRRQQEVLELLRRDFTNEQIAQRLGISLDGAKWHVSEIIGRLGVADRHEAARWRTEGESRPWWILAWLRDLSWFDGGEARHRRDCRRLSSVLERSCDSRSVVRQAADRMISPRMKPNVA